jgi:PIN domain
MPLDVSIGEQVAKNRKTPEMDALLFVDTNILLDFYRIRKSDISMKYLEQLEACEERLIVGAQIEVEYKKNRQKVIVESLTQFSTPDWGKLSTPALVAGLQASKMIEKKREEITDQYKTVNEKIQKILTNPSQNDPVFQSLQRLFKSNSPYNLNRESKKRFTIRRLARKRFCLGYPPRKSNDTSIGDAVNWEWIVQCAIDSGKDIVIVTRDNDYGVTYKDQSYLNDWLKQEFQQRVSQRRKILLTHKLSAGLKIVHAAVTEEMEKAEQQLIESQNIPDDSHHKSIGEFIG